MALADFYEGGISSTDLYLPLAAITVLLLVVVLYLLRRKIRHAWLNLRTRKRLNGLGVRVISDFRFPDGLGSHFMIDRLVLRQDGISLLVLKQYPGSIFCAEDIAEWTQMLAGKSYRFKNPLIDLDYQVKAVASCVPGVPVDGYIFFDHQAWFPKGRPARVIDIDSIPDSLQRVKKAVAKPSVMAAWEELRTRCAAA